MSGDQRESWRVVGRGLTCPAATSLRPDELHLFARTATGDLLQRRSRDDRWSDWRSLGVPVATGSTLSVGVDWQFAACGQDGGRMDLFARSPDGELVRKTWDGAAWEPLRCLGSPAAASGDVAIPMGVGSAPAACSAGSGRVEVFVVGHEGDVLHTSHDGTAWTEFTSLGAPELQFGQRARTVPAVGPPSACACGQDRMGVIVRGPLGDILLKWWDGQAWSEFASLGMPEVPYGPYPAVTVSAAVAGPPAACSWGPERMDVFVRGPRGTMLHKWWNGQDWSAFRSLGMPGSRSEAMPWTPFTGAVTACSPAPGRIDVFARAADGDLYHRRLEPEHDTT